MSQGNHLTDVDLIITLRSPAYDSGVCRHAADRIEALSSHLVFDHVAMCETCTRCVPDCEFGRWCDLLGVACGTVGYACGAHMPQRRAEDTYQADAVPSPRREQALNPDTALLCRSVDVRLAASRFVGLWLGIVVGTLGAVALQSWCGSHPLPSLDTVQPWAGAPRPTLADVRAPRTRASDWVSVGADIAIKFVPRSPARVCYSERCVPLVSVTDLIVREGAERAGR